MMKHKYLLFLILMGVVVSSCNKFLDKKPDKQLVVPETIQDIQALYDQNTLMNGYGTLTGDASADDYYLPEDIYNGLSSEYYKETYTWGREIMGSSITAWSFLYNVVYQANVGLETLSNVPITVQNKDDWNNIKGSGLFYRSNSFQQLVFDFSLAYDSSSSMMDLGIPLRLNSDFNETSSRATVEQSYRQIIGDLKTAAGLLPNHPLFPTRPSRPAAYGLLARVCLAMRQYQLAENYADSCIMNYGGQLLDYNTLDASKAYPITAFNSEVIFYEGVNSGSPLTISYARIDSDFYKMYQDEDLRKNLFFKPNLDGTISFKGTYLGKFGNFVGIALDEIFLIRAECKARLGNYKSGMDDLNKLLANRYKTGSYNNLVASDANEALALILLERRKELLFRDLRWMDIKRLNKEGYGISLKRIIGDDIYTLDAGSNRFALPLPSSVITLTGMQQNPE